MIENEIKPITNKRDQKRRGFAQLHRLKQLIVGAGATSFHIDERGIWAGAEDFDDAPFRVDMEGNVTATSLTLGDFLEVGEALTDVQASIAAGLSDISADLGSINAGDINGVNITGSTITGGDVQTASTGLRLRMNGTTNSYEFLSGATVLAELKSTTVPFSGTSGAAVRHGTGKVMLEVSGSGEGLGGRQALLINSSGSTYVGLQDTDDGNFYIVMGGLPTSSPGGSGRVWNDGGTLKIT